MHTHQHHLSKTTLVTALGLGLTSMANIVYAEDYSQKSPSQPNNIQQSYTQQGNSQTDDGPTTTLETIVITATKTDRALSDSPVPVNLISNNTLKNNQARTLKDALQLLPNVILQEVHGKTGYEVIMQGLSSDQVLVLIDGLPVTASTGSTVNLNQYLNVEVEQVEVIQGASSAQYGSSAMGGVINVITKKIDNQLGYGDKRKRMIGHITAEVATNTKENPSGDDIDVNKSYVDASLDMGLDKDGKWLARVSASRLADEGLSLDSAEWSRIKDNSEQTQLSARLQYQPKATQAKADDSTEIWLEVTNYQEEDESRFNRRVAQNIVPRQKLESIDKNRFSAGFRHQFNTDKDISEQGQLQGKLFYEDYDSASDTYSITANGKVINIDRDANMSNKMVQLQYDLPEIQLGEGNLHQLQIGGQWQQDELSQSNNGNSELTSDIVDRDVTELYLQDDWFIGDNWEVLTGIRYQEDSDFGDHIAPKIAVKYNYLNDRGNEHIFRASVGQGYRVPNLKERYYVFDHSVYGYMVKGNPDLQPETSDSYQLGYQGEITDRLNISANAFYNEINELIQTDSDSPLVQNNVAIYQYRNIDSASTYGGDLGLNWQVDDNNRLNATYAYTKTKNDTTGTELVGRPEHKATLALTSEINSQWGEFSLSNRLNYASKHLVSTTTQAYSPSYWTFDTKVNYQASPALRLHAGINNVFDQQRDFKDPNDQSPVDSRQWVIGASYDF